MVVKVDITKLICLTFAALIIFSVGAMAFQVDKQDMKKIASYEKIKVAPRHIRIIKNDTKALQTEFKLLNNTDFCFLNCNATIEITGNLPSPKWFFRGGKLKKYGTSLKSIGKDKWLLTITGNKHGNESVDWILNAWGINISEWAWWNATYLNRKAITIFENSGTELYNYPVAINISYNIHMQPDFSELRFTY